MPVDREQLIKAKISGPAVWNIAFKNQAGMQCEGQVDSCNRAFKEWGHWSELMLKFGRSQRQVLWILC